MFLQFCNTWSHPTRPSKMPQVVHDVISQRIMSVQILQLPGAHIQLMKCEVLAHASSWYCLVKNRLQVLSLLVLNYHLVEDNAAHYDVCDGVQIILPARIFDNLPTALQHSKSTLHVLAGSKLHLRVMLLLLTLGLMNWLQEATPLQVYPVRQQVVSTVDMSIHLECHVTTFSAPK